MVMVHAAARRRDPSRFYQHLSVVALLVLALTACAPQEPLVIIVTATDLPGPTSTPAPTATPTIPPTPTIAPEQLLQMGDQALLNGQFEAALLDYQSILGMGAAADLSAAAAFNAGRAALREGDFTGAAANLTTFITNFPQDARTPQAYFLRGDANMGLSQWAAALSDYQTYLSLRPGLIDSYAYERIGDAQLAMGQSAESVASYNRAVNAGRALVPLLQLRERLAQIYLGAGSTVEAVAQYDAILQVARNNPYRATIEYAAADALIDGNDISTGYARLQSIIELYPDRPEAYNAMQRLIQAGIPIDDYQRGQISYTYGDYEGAINAFNTYSTERPIADLPAEMYLLLGRAYREIGNPTAAVTAFQTIIDQYPSDPLFGQALLEQGRTRFLAGEIDDAIARYQEIARTYGYLPEAAEALWRAGYLHGTNDRPVESRQIFEQLADAYPDTEQARSGLFLAAAAAYNEGDANGAERLYARLAVSTTGEDQAAAYLWVGRLAAARSDQQTAVSALNLAIQAAPDSYYSARAQDILNGRDTFARPVGYNFTFDETAQLAEAETWLRQRFQIEGEAPLWPLSPELQADARLIRGNELWAVGAVDAAKVEFGDVIDAYQSDAVRSFQIALFLRGIGAYQPAVLAGANVIRAAGVATLEAPPYLARLRYPAYYADLVQDAAARYQVDPLLLLSLIRHESLFDTYATAGAGEKGLTQVIPGTAEYIAQQINWPDYQHSDLFRPYAGIEFGAFFLGENLGRFEGNVQAALAGYNAGPGRAANWLSLSGGDPDQFITAITIDSTRTYVQRIYGFYTIYRALYGVM
ncbi:MAG TPA: tetratricopeptide repeat protein [Aggregatilineales bacterium]|nr:tetratricopeptide repeat protein [Aggregatilineales bacterium]